MTLDHTLTWEIARVGGMLAYVLVTASVALGLLAFPQGHLRELATIHHQRASPVRDAGGPRLHRPPYARGPARPLHRLLADRGVRAAGGPLSSALDRAGNRFGLPARRRVGVRVRPKAVGYAWWRRFHYLAFAVFLLGTLHGLGTGSDSGQPWALALYAMCGGLVTLLLAARLVLAIPRRTGDVAVFAVGARLRDTGRLRHHRPGQSGWNAFANNGNGSGASAAWLAAHPTTAQASTAPTPGFAADVVATLVDDEQLRGTFTGDGSDDTGTLQLAIDEGTVMLELDFADGWTVRWQRVGGRRGIIGRKLQRTRRSDRGRHPDGPSAASRWGDRRQPGGQPDVRLALELGDSTGSTVRRSHDPAGSPRIPTWRDQRTTKRPNWHGLPGRESAPSSGHFRPFSGPEGRSLR